MYVLSLRDAREAFGGTSLPHITNENVHIKASANPVQGEDKADTYNGSTLHIGVGDY